jgi:G3E family GTPase
MDLLKQNIDEEDIENLVIQQIEFCNIVLLNKVNEVSHEELGRVRSIVRELQPKAEIIDCNFGDVDLDKIIHTDMFDFDAVATSAKWIEEVEKHHDDKDHDDEDSHDEHHHHHHHHHHDHHDEGEAEEYGIGTYVYYRRGPFELGLFDEFVARKWPKGIIRAKGVCYFRDEPDTCYVFEQAGKQVNIRNAGQWYATMPKDELEDFMVRNPGLQRDWDEEYGDRMQKLVFIGQHLDKELIAKELDACLSK